MKVKLLGFSALMLLTLNSFCQSTVLRFTADNNHSYVQLDSIKVYNLTQNTESLHIWPDTAFVPEALSGDEYLFIGYAQDYSVDIKEKEIVSDRLTLYRNYPNPMMSSTVISFYIPDRGDVSLGIFDMSGRKLNTFNRALTRA